MMTPELI